MLYIMYNIRVGADSGPSAFTPMGHTPHTPTTDPPPGDLAVTSRRTLQLLQTLFGGHIRLPSHVCRSPRLQYPAKFSHWYPNPLGLSILARQKRMGGRPTLKPAERPYTASLEGCESGGRGGYFPFC